MADNKQEQDKKREDTRSDFAKAWALHSIWLGRVMGVGIFIGGLVWAASCAFNGNNTPPADEPAPVETPAVDTTTAGVESKIMPSGPSIW